jgi:uncharacterized protein YydD (DUF2326 family)
MRLIKLTANQSTFKTVEFNRSGISIISAQKQNPDEKGGTKTFNSVGKSLTVALIHFCLASNKVEAFEESLDGWIFSLEFEVEGKKYISSRSTISQDIIILNDKETTLTTFRSKFGKEVFNLTTKINYLTFRSLLIRFIRPKKGSYNDFDQYEKEERPYPQLLNNAYLIGLDTSLVERKYSLKESFDKLKKSKRVIQNDPLIKSVLKKPDKTQLTILNLEEETKRLEGKLKVFQIADDYNKIRIRANELSYDITALDNKSKVLANTIRHIDKSLQIQPDVSSSQIIALYQEANSELPELVKKRLVDVEEFHNKIVSDRAQNLATEKSMFESQLSNIEKEKEELGKERDQLLKYLDAHGALEEYTALHSQLLDLKTKLTKLKDSQTILDQMSEKMNELRKDLYEENVIADKYIHNSSFAYSDFASSFRELSRAFYDNKPGTIVVSNNEGENTIRFGIKAHIDTDAGDGVRQVKIFCFDLALMLARHNHKMQFLFHDSRILDGMDARQQTILFKTAYAKSLDLDFQYIISINQTDLDSIKSEMNNTALYKKIIEDNIVLKLTDESEKGKLLGISVDMDYESKD